MADSNDKKFVNKILIIVIGGLLLQIIGGGFWTWTVSRDNSKEIIYIKEDVKENKEDVKKNKELFYLINEKLTKLEAYIKPEKKERRQ